VHTSAKARLTCVTKDLDPYPDRHQNLILCSLAYCPHSLKISCKYVQKFLCKVANGQTDRQTTTITYPPWWTVEVITFNYCAALFSNDLLLNNCRYSVYWHSYAAVLTHGRLLDGHSSSLHLPCLPPAYILSCIFSILSVDCRDLGHSLLVSVNKIIKFCLCCFILFAAEAFYPYAYLHNFKIFLTPSLIILNYFIKIYIC